MKKLILSLEKDVNTYNGEDEVIIEKLSSKQDVGVEDFIEAFAYSDRVEKLIFGAIYKVANIPIPEEDREADGDDAEDNFESLIYEFVDEHMSDLGWGEGVKFPPFTLKYQKKVLYTEEELIAMGVCFTEETYNAFIQEGAKAVTEMYKSWKEENE